jgi:hypothetical protein
MAFDFPYMVLLVWQVKTAGIKLTAPRQLISEELGW